MRIAQRNLRKHPVVVVVELIGRHHGQKRGKLLQLKLVLLVLPVVLLLLQLIMLLLHHCGQNTGAALVYSTQSLTLAVYLETRVRCKWDSRS